MRTTLFLVLFACLLSVAYSKVPREANPALKLTLLSETKYPLAKCLDGSQAGYYTSFSGSSTDYIIFFQGGAWCYSGTNCLDRSNSTLGSSLNWESQLKQYGIMSNDCATNPRFCSWNKIFLRYCDGSSFGGKSEMTVNGIRLYSHGDYIVDAVLDDVMSQGALEGATSVMVSGCSAGGLASILHTTRVYSFLSSRLAVMPQFGTLVLSGVFVDETNVEKTYVYREQIKKTYAISKADFGPEPHKCLKVYEHERWRCMLATHMLPFLDTPVFIINSVVDSWQLSCIVMSLPELQIAPNKSQCGKAPGWKACASDFANCSASQFSSVLTHASLQLEATHLNNTMLTQLSTPAGRNGLRIQLASLSLPPNSGAFLHTCQTHCEATAKGYEDLAIDGVTMTEAVWRWWREKQGDHVYLPCRFTIDAPYQCNPTCPSMDNIKQMQYNFV